MRGRCIETLLVLLVAVVVVPLISALTCYQCSSGQTGCTTTCANAASCAYQITLPLLTTNQVSTGESRAAMTMDMTGCNSNISRPGCIGDIMTQTFTCYCIADYCNRSLNSTLGVPESNSTAAAVAPPPAGASTSPPGVSSMPPQMPANVQPTALPMSAAVGQSPAPNMPPPAALVPNTTPVGGRRKRAATRSTSSSITSTTPNSSIKQ